MKPYLSVCAIYRDEADYLEEWLEFHLLVGVERFFLYNNRSADRHLRVLAPYIEEGLVVHHDWPFAAAQLRAYDHCIETHREDARWIAIIDLDEFLFSPTGRKVSEILPEYEPWPAVGVNWAVFGSSGHLTRPEGLVVENYVWRTSQAKENRTIKTILNPTRTVGAGGNPHWFAYEGGALAVDENKQPIDRPWGRTQSVSFERLRVNHYHTKSAEEARRKYATVRADAGTWRRPRPHRFDIERLEARRGLRDVRDETIQTYLPALREAIARRHTARPG